MASRNGDGLLNRRQKAEGTPAGAADLVRMSTVVKRRVDWLWHPWLPVGELALLEGDPGLAKSTLTIDWIARVTRGWSMPPDATGEQVTEPAPVVIMSAEDDPESVIRPRLDAAGADCDLVWFFPKVTTGKTTSRLPVLPDDLSLLNGRFGDRNPRLLVVDPLMAFVGGEYDAHKDSDIRHCLHAALVVVREMHSCLLMVRHLNKLSLSPAMYRGGGSIGIIGASRVAITAGRDPDDRERHVIAQAKNNLAIVPPGLAYHVETDVGQDCGRIVWDGMTDLEPDEILGHAPAGSRGKPADRLRDAVSFLEQLLKHGPIAASVVAAGAKKAGIRTRTITTARNRLDVRASRAGEAWFLELPPGHSVNNCALDTIGMDDSEGSEDENG